MPVPGLLKVKSSSVIIWFSLRSCLATIDLLACFRASASHSNGTFSY